MTCSRHVRRARFSPQQGSFMLEALIAILIVALGVLGMVGLYARSVQNVDDSKYRGEAALLASSLVGQMWVTNNDFATLKADYESTPGTGTGFKEFKALVAQRFPNSKVPIIVVTAGPTATSSNVLITMQWEHPSDKGDPLLTAPRKYVLNATVGSNAP